jgi:hypothetical protein
MFPNSLGEGFDWMNWYMEFASKLLGYKHDRKELLNVLNEAWDELEISA